VIGDGDLELQKQEKRHEKQDAAKNTQNNPRDHGKFSFLSDFGLELVSVIYGEDYSAVSSDCSAAGSSISMVIPPSSSSPASPSTMGVSSLGGSMVSVAGSSERD